jgi:hypothetical protein
LYLSIQFFLLKFPVTDIIRTMNKKRPENNLESESALKVLDSLLKDSGQKKISENQILIILDALASSDDTEVVARFPAVLAICARRGLALNSDQCSDL